MGSTERDERAAAKLKQLRRRIERAYSRAYSRRIAGRIAGIKNQVDGTAEYQTWPEPPVPPKILRHCLYTARINLLSSGRGGSPQVEADARRPPDPPAGGFGPQT